MISEKYHRLTIFQSWLKNFKAGHGVRKLNVCDNLKSADVVGGINFKITFIFAVSENELTTCQIYNADENRIFVALPVGSWMRIVWKFSRKINTC